MGRPNEQSVAFARCHEPKTSGLCHSWTKEEPSRLDPKDRRCTRLLDAGRQRIDDERQSVCVPQRRPCIGVPIDPGETLQVRVAGALDQLRGHGQTVRVATARLAETY